MKYDFSTYILNKLNEADEKKKEKVFTDDYDAKTKTFNLKDEDSIENWIAKNYNNLTIKKGNLIYTSPEDNEEYTLKSKFDIKKLYNEIKESSGNKPKSLDKEGFKLLGKTIAYRSALTVWSMINTSGDDFKQAALDVFKDNSEYSIKQLENLESLLDYSAAIGVVKDKKNRLDKNDANYETLLKKCNDAEAQLATKENYTTIQQIKKDYEKEFKDKRDLFEQSFNKGMAEQKKEMQAKDYKWKDPVTEKEPKGAEKLNKLGDKAYKMLESGVEKASDFAKRQQGLDKALLTLAVVGVKGMIFGAKVLKNLLTGIIKRSNMHDCLRNTAKFKDIENKIKIFMKEYEEWNKENSEQSNKEDKTDEEKKQEEDKKKTILMKLSELMNTHVMPYYYAKLAIITACIENKENKYIIKQEDNKWSTYNTSTGRLTVIEDNTILMYHLLKFLTDDKQIPGFRTGFNKVLETFGDEKPNFNLPTDVNFNSTYRTNLSNWLDRATTVKDIKNPHLPFRIEKFKEKWEQFYKEELYKKSFANYKEFLEFCRKAQELLHDVHLPVAKGIRLKFKGDEDAGVPGVVTGAKKEDNQEEENNNSQDLKAKYKTITDELVALKELNDMNKVTETIDKVNGEITKFENGIKSILDKMDKDEKVKKNEVIQKYHKIIFADGTTTLKQILFAKTLMTIFDLKESVYLNNIVKLMNEEKIPNVENRVNNTKKAVNSFIEKKLTNNDNIADLAKYCDKITNEIHAIYETLIKDDKDRDNKIQNKLQPYNEDPLKLLYAMSMLDQLKTPENTASEGNTEQNTEGNNEPEEEKVANTAEKEKNMVNA